MNVENAPRRVCNSDDTVGSSDCIWDSDFVYPETRIHNGNWESSIFYAWVMQIIMMEILGVPTTVGLTTETTAVSGFYSQENQLAYSSAAYPFESLRGAGQCQHHNEECAHVMPEVWNGQFNEWTQAINDGYIEPIEGNGQVGKGSWYVPAFTARQDATLVSVYGISGEDNRQKLAKAFLSPTNWRDYCEEVSPTNCSSADETASHYPQSAGDANKYFAPGSFQGHFRTLPKNNCTLYPDTCMGNIIGPACSWSTNIDAQLYWNDIHLKPDGPLQPNGGYGYSSLLEIWRAANATESNVMMWWWRPEPMVEEFHGTKAQFQQLLLPEATDTCSKARVDTEARCSEDIMERRGDPEGACDQEAHALQKIVSKAFADSNRAESPEFRSPSYDFVKAFKLTDLEINNMLRRWNSNKVDPYGNSAREAVCSWVVDHLDDLMTFVPKGYPKQLSDKSLYKTAFLYAARTVALLCAVMVLAFGAMSYRWRSTRVFVYAQAHIVYMIVFGAFLITIGAYFAAVEPSAAACGATEWLVNMGYTLKLVPLLVKVAAINQIHSGAQKMKRVKISRSYMFKQVGAVTIMVLAFLIVWESVDPIDVVEERVLPDGFSTFVETTLTCSSEHEFWVVLTLSWQALLLVMASVLAFQSRGVIEEFNESQRLGIMIYSHMIFLVLRGGVYMLSQNGTFSDNASSGVLSFLLSFDTLFAMLIYLLPKCLEACGSPLYSDASKGTVRSTSGVSIIEQRAAAAQASYMSTHSITDGAYRSGSAISLQYPAHSNGSMSSSVRSSTGNPAAVANEWHSPHRNSMKSKVAIALTDLKEVSCESSCVDISTSEDLANGGNGESPGSDLLMRANSGSNHQPLTLQNPLDMPTEQIPSLDLNTESEEGKMPRKNSLDLADLGLYDDSEDSSEEFGGPRYTNDRANKVLEKSVHAPMMLDDFKIDLTEDYEQGGHSSPVSPQEFNDDVNKDWKDAAARQDIVTMAHLEYDRNQQQEGLQDYHEDGSITNEPFNDV